MNTTLYVAIIVGGINVWGDSHIRRELRDPSKPKDGHPAISLFLMMNMTDDGGRILIISLFLLYVD